MENGNKSEWERKIPNKYNIHNFHFFSIFATYKNISFCICGWGSSACVGGDGKAVGHCFVTFENWFIGSLNDWRLHAADIVRYVSETGKMSPHEGVNCLIIGITIEILPLLANLSTGKPIFPIIDFWKIISFMTLNH